MPTKDGYYAGELANFIYDNRELVKEFGKLSLDNLFENFFDLHEVVKRPDYAINKSYVFTHVKYRLKNKLTQKRPTALWLNYCYGSDGKKETSGGSPLVRLYGEGDEPIGYPHFKDPWRSRKK